MEEGKKRKKEGREEDKSMYALAKLDGKILS